MKKYRSLGLFLLTAGMILIILIYAHNKTKEEIASIIDEKNPVIVEDHIFDQAPINENGDALYIFDSSEYPPYVTSTKSKPTGLSYEILELVLNSMNVKYEIKIESWNRGIYELNRGESFGVFPYAATGERRIRYLFSDAFYENSKKKDVFYAYSADMKTELLDLKWEDLSKLRVGGVYGYYYIEKFEQNNITVDLSTDELECLKKLRDRKIDVAVFDPLAADYLINEKFKNETQFFRKTGLTMVPEGVGDFLMVRKEDPRAEAFLKRFNEELRILKENGSIDKIVNKYYF